MERFVSICSEYFYDYISASAINKIPLFSSHYFSAVAAGSLHVRELWETCPSQGAI